MKREIEWRVTQKKGMTVEKNKNLEPIYLTKQQVAVLCACSPRTIDNLEKAGLIRPIRHKRFVRYPREEVVALRVKLSEGAR